MDAIVEAALRKWPNVPHCHGWLALDARGDWYMRDERIQAAGPFPRVKGSRITHDKLREFIHRNYAHDEAGAWFFQNGPQRVYVQLEAAPWVWRVQADGEVAGAGGPARTWLVTSHTGLAAQVLSCWLDDGRPTVPRYRPRLRPGAHAGHGRGGRRPWSKVRGNPEAWRSRPCQGASAMSWSRRRRCGQRAEIKAGRDGRAAGPRSACLRSPWRAGCT